MSDCWATFMIFLSFPIFLKATVLNVAPKESRILQSSLSLVNRHWLHMFKSGLLILGLIVVSPTEYPDTYCVFFGLLLVWNHRIEEWDLLILKPVLLSLKLENRLTESFKNWTNAFWVDRASPLGKAVILNLARQHLKAMKNFVFFVVTR